MSSRVATSCRSICSVADELRDVRDEERDRGVELGHVVDLHGRAQLARVHRAPGFDGGDQLLRGRVRHAGDAAQREHVVDGARRTADDRGERELGEHEARRHVEVLRASLAPRGDGLRDLCLLAAQPGRALDLPPRGVGLGSLQVCRAQSFALGRGPRLAAQVFEPMAQRDRERRSRYTTSAAA